ncbi:unconventional myosin-XIX [Nilaparvata lugens]|uniref:unconventional myosin-XIX n=1 Tax=Nilaparvata lugens TaxID=108931 RepID=UPI00193EABF3|nr:unconventional myosin-XIX [Nilaparvata lugens]
MSFSSVGDFEIQEDFVQYLSARYFNNDYCTWLDLVLISINPLKKLHVTENINNALKKALKGESLIGTNVPHIYSVVHRALCYLSVNRQDQIIVFSGDSGSGKSHAAEEALNFIADVDTPLNQICHAQTLLSCFGNAATEYHGNSSRFGNLLLLNYSELSKTILKARLRTYLLEKTRVSSPSVRNFHVFYQLIVACKSTGQDGLYLNTDRKFRILPGQITADDENGYKKMFKAFAGLDFDWPTIKSIFEVISGILHLGNIVFKSSEESGFHAEVNWEESYDDLQRACELLGFESEMLALILTNSLISFDKHESRTIQIPVTSTRDATTRRDALMKLLYSLLFNWIVSYINNKFDRGDTLTTFKLGLLDIYGFEMLSRNSLEQLCINYANERLHNYFVQDILVQKKKILEDEGILSELNTDMEEDYSKKAIARINLLDAPNSVFSVLNEGSLLIHHCEGEEVCHKLENLPENDLIKVDRYNEKFVIKHFAGNVTYNSNHMVEKNSDKVPNELINILLNSSKEFVIKLVAEDSSHTLKHTVLGKFKRSLDLLMLELKNAEVHYVRCIKPNVQMKPGLIDKQFFEKQLRSSGITEAVKLCGHCLPIRLNIGRFCSHFGCLMNGGKIMNDDINKLKYFKKWADDLELNHQIGDSENIFLEEIVFKDLENKVQFLKRHSSRIIQKAWLRYRHKTCKSVSPSSSVVQKYSSPRQLDIGELEETNNYNVRLVLNSDIGRLQCSEDLIDEMNRSSELQRLLSLQSSNNENIESSTILELIEDESFPTNQNHLPALPAPPNSEQAQIQNPFDYNEINAFSSSVVSESSDSHKPQIPQMNCAQFDYDEIYTFPSSVEREPSDSHNPQMNSSRKISSELKEYRLTGKLKKKEVSCISSNQYNYKLLKKIVTSEKRVGTEVFFMSNTGIVSRRALAKVPIWFHTKKTCIPYSHIVHFL